MSWRASERRLTVIVLTNRTGGEPWDIAQRIAELPSALRAATLVASQVARRCIQASQPLLELPGSSGAPQDLEPQRAQRTQRKSNRVLPSSVCSVSSVAYCPCRARRRHDAPPKRDATMSSMNATKVLDGVIGAAVLVGVLGMLAGPVVTFAGRQLPLGRIEFPLVDVQSVDVGARGSIVLSNVYYGRIQLYDSSGRFTRGWPADASGGGFTASFLDSGHVASFASRRHSTVVYTLEGDRVREDAGSASPEERSGRLAVRAPDGSSVSVLGAQLWPTVVRERGGVRSPLVTQPWYLRLFGPLSVALLFVAILLQHTMRPVRVKRSRPA